MENQAMADIVATVATALNMTKHLVDLAKLKKDLEIREAASNLRVEVAEIKVQLADLLEENATLKEQLTRATRKGGKDLEFKNGLYYDGDGGGPFCPGCYDTGYKSIRVTRQKAPFNDFGDFQCPACKEFFYSTE